jgi:hypothetical protein
MSAYACSLIALGLLGSVSVQEIRLTGWIPCEGRLDLVNLGPSLWGESSGRSVQARITGVGADRVPVVLSLRTNCSYSVTATWVGTADTPAGIAEPTVGGGERHRPPPASSVV